MDLMLRPVPRRPAPLLAQKTLLDAVLPEDGDGGNDNEIQVADPAFFADPEPDESKIEKIGDLISPVVEHDLLENSPSADVEAAIEDGSGSIYFGEIRLLNWTTTAKGGMKADFAILDCPADIIHPFKGLLCGKQNGQRLRVWFGDLSETNENVVSLHQGEALLLRWSDDSVNGMYVQVMLDDGPDGVKGLHPFMGLPIGRVEGHRMKMAAWAINDDESIIDPRKVRRNIPFYQKPETTQAHILSRNPRFISYVKRHEVRLTAGVEIRADVTAAPAEYIAEAIYAILGITSRKELGYDNAVGREARKRWSKLLGEYFDDYYGRR